MPSTSQPLHESYRQLIRFCALAAFFVHMAFIPIFAHHGVMELALFNIGSISIHAAAFWLARPHGNVGLGADLIGIEVAAHAIAATVAIGWNSGFHYLMIPLVPVCMLSTTRTRPVRLAIVVIASLLYMGLMYWSDHYQPYYQIDSEILSVLHYGCATTLFLTFMTVAARYHDIIAEAQEALAREAATDPLTGALNRRRLTQLASELPKSQPSALLLCDLDHFKQVNDTYGHDAGDTVLQTFHQLLQDGARSGDYVARWGGEEFLVLLPNTQMDVARQVAQRLRQQLERTPIILCDGSTLHVTVTIGLARMELGDSLQSAVRRADEALYKGKESGRNQVHDSSDDAMEHHPAESLHQPSLL